MSSIIKNFKRILFVIPEYNITRQIFVLTNIGANEVQVLLFTTLKPRINLSLS